MKAVLTLDFIKRLRRDQKPTGFDEQGRLRFEVNDPAKDYIIYDASDSAPPGFGVRVSAKKTYILRRTVKGKETRPKVGNVADYASLADARSDAQKLAVKIIESGGRNPNKASRVMRAHEITLGDAMEAYKNHLMARANNPGRSSTIKMHEQAKRRFLAAGWLDRPVPEISSSEILRLFEEKRKTAPSANEQNFRAASTSIEAVIEQETLDAAAQNRKPTLVANPFKILTIKGMYRSRDQLENARELNRKRNPLGPMTSLGNFLEAAWSKKNSNDNETGAHSFILSLLWGTRKSEHVSCVWGDLLSETERLTTSHVWLEESGNYGPYMYLSAEVAKNRKAHRLPLGRMALELLQRRRTLSAEESAKRGFDRKSRKWVFPAKSKFSRSGHYTDGSTLLKAIAAESGVEKIAPHDLRRTFGAVMTSIDVPEGIKSRFLNHSGKNSVTATYTRAEWLLLKDWIEKIEQAILSKAPNVYNSLKPVDWPPLAAPEPHVCQPAKPRSGRPKKVHATPAGKSVVVQPMIKE